MLGATTPLHKKVIASMLLAGGPVLVCTIAAFGALGLLNAGTTLAFEAWLGLSAAIAAAGLLAFFALAHLFSRKLQREVAEPLRALAETAAVIARERDYSMRAAHPTQPEIARLATAFNQVLDQVDEQNVALSDSAQRLRAVLDSALSAVILMDASGRVTEWNACAERIFGWIDSEAIGRDLADLVIPQRYRAAHRAGLSRFLATMEIRVIGRTLEMTALRRDGTEFAAELSVSVLRSGAHLSFCGFVTDITDRKHAESRIQAQLSRLNLLHRITRAIGEREDLPSICQVVIRSLEDDLPIDLGCVLRYEDPLPQLTVIASGARGETLAAALDLSPGRHVTIDGNGLSHCVAGELVHEPDLADTPFEFPRRLADCGLRALVAAPLRVEGKTFGVLIAARRKAHSFSSGDCEFLRQLSEHVALAVHQVQLHAQLQVAYDELRQSQHTILQQERLRALGQMASGIAHDINNAISPITLYTDTLLERERGLSERGRAHLVTIQRAIDDVANTVARLREFYRPREQQLVLSAVDLNALARQVVDMTEARWRDVPQESGVFIDMRLELDPQLPRVAGAEGEIRDALTNLVFNAVDAMPGGGTLTIRSRSSTAPAADGVGGQRFAEMEVADTGVGMTEETRRRCLEPFFTTKGERGTGLGLAMVYGMVQRHSGSVAIDSVPGSGTTVQLSFPVSTPAAAFQNGPHDGTAMPALAILVVDDDPLLLRSLREILQNDGHAVTCADGGRSGIEAFAAARERGETFALVITDLGMPHVDGRAVAAQIKAQSPRTPVLMLTGWGQRLIATNNVPPYVDRVLSKPPKLRDLRAALAELTGQMPDPQ